MHTVVSLYVALGMRAGIERGDGGGGEGGGNAIGYWSREARKSKYPGVSRQSRREINK